MMNVHVILAGLKKDIADACLQRMEALVSQLPESAEYTVYQSGCENCLAEIRRWASCKTLVAGEPDGFEGADLVLVCGTPEAKELGMRLAAALKKPCRTEVISFED